MNESLSPLPQPAGAAVPSASRRNEPTADAPPGQAGAPASKELPAFRPFGQGVDDRSSWIAGTLIGSKYTMIRPIGVGGMGMVWVARNEATGGEVAIKMLLPRAAQDRAELLARFRREASLTAKMRHRAIVRVYDLLELPHVGPSNGSDVDEEQASIAIVMELLDGETLGRLLERQRHLTTHEAVDVALPILSALAHAHDAGIVHRDLKPENVFLSADTDGCITPKILDFGISKLDAKHAPALTRDGEMLGTPSYMSPEQARSAPLDGRSDLFNVGILLYEMLTGQNPFAGEGFHAVLVAILEIDPPPLPSSVSPELASVVMRALSKRPEDRFAGAREMSAALRAAVGDEAASSQPRLNVASLGESFSTREAWKSLHEIIDATPAPMVSSRDSAPEQPYQAEAEIEPATIPVAAGPVPPPPVVIPVLGGVPVAVTEWGPSSARASALEIAPSAKALSAWRTWRGPAAIGAGAALVVVALLALVGSRSNDETKAMTAGPSGNDTLVADAVLTSPSSAAAITAAAANATPGSSAFAPARAVQNLEVVTPRDPAASLAPATSGAAEGSATTSPPIAASASASTTAMTTASASPSASSVNAKSPASAKTKKHAFYRNPGF